MKHLKTFESYTDSDIKRMIDKTTNKGDMDLRVSPEEFITNGKAPELGSFEYFVSRDEPFYSEGVKSRIGEFVDKFKELGLDISKIENIKDTFKKVQDLDYQIDNLRFDYSTPVEEKYDEEERLEAEIEELKPSIELLKIEISRLIKEVRSKKLI